MKKKILGMIVDILLIALVFAMTDIVLRKVFCSENLWLELGIYIVLYGVVFGAKKAVELLWNRLVSGKKKENSQNPE